MDELRARVAGEVIEPGGAGYDRYRSVFDQRVDRRPVAIVRCRTRDDVVAALAFRAERDLPVAVRCGATSAYATVDGGIVVDVSPMKAVRIDAGARAARIGAGLTWAELDAATQEHGLAVTGGRVSATGVAGVTLGGGSGWLERALGPTCQSLGAAEVVLADGRFVRASEEENADLLWALRGGGGGFGVMTELELRLHPLGPTVLAGFLTFPRARAGEVARSYRDCMERAPDEVGGGLLLFAGRGGACTVVFCFAGTIEDGERAIAPLRALGPSLDAVAPNEYRAFQSMNDLHHPYGARVHLRDGLLRELSDAALQDAIAAADQPASALSQVMLRPLGGALRRADSDAMALSVPDAPWAYQCLSIWPPVASLDRGNIEWVRRFCEAVEPYSAGAAGDSDAIDRLQRVKERYDPANVFGQLSDLR